MTDLDMGNLAQPRRLKTRKRICDAAHECFVRAGVVGTSVDDIVTKAGVSRATFYLHYNSKEAILVDLLRAQSVPLQKLYGRLRDIGNLEIGAIRAWIELYVDAVKQHRQQLYLFALGLVSDAEPRALIVAQRMEAIATLGQRFAAFRLAGEDARKTSNCLMMMFQIEQTVSALVHGDVATSPTIMVDVLAERLHDFLVS